MRYYGIGSVECSDLKSAAAKESIELDDKSFGDIIKEEIDMINVKHGRRGTTEEENL